MSEENNISEGEITETKIENKEETKIEEKIEEKADDKIQLKEDETEEKEEDGKKEIKKEDTPIVYEEFTIPEGMEANAEMLTEISETFKGLKLNQEQAQSIVNIYTKGLETQVKKMSDAHDNTIKEWETELKEDKEFGGTNFDKRIKTSENAINKLDLYGIKKVLADFGLDKNPAVVKTFHLIGRNFIENGSIVKGKQPSTQERTAGGSPMLNFPSMDKQN